MKRSDTFAIHNAKVSELGQEILSEQSELRNLTPDHMDSILILRFSFTDWWSGV